MPVKRRTPKRRQDLPPEALEWLHDGDGGAFVYFPEPWTLASLWSEFGEEITAEHIAEHPGTRPLRWWQYDAPEPRRRVSGTGTPCHERLANVLRLAYGVPMDWINAYDVRIYQLIGTDPGVPAINPNDPPLYESEATYLKRLRLLLPGEARRLTPEDFAPESVLNVLGWTRQTCRDGASTTSPAALPTRHVGRTAETAAPRALRATQRRCAIRRHESEQRVPAGR